MPHDADGQAPRPMGLAQLTNWWKSWRRRQFLVTGERDPGALVEIVYKTMLERAPDEAGRRDWIRFLRAGGRPSQMLRLVSESEEYRLRHGLYGRAAIKHPQVSSAVATHRLRILILGNCQGRSLARSIHALTGGAMPEVIHCDETVLRSLRSGDRALVDRLDEGEVLLVQRPVLTELRAGAPKHAERALVFPVINFSAFHPDLVYAANRDGGFLSGPMGPYHSSLVLLGWRNGWGPDATLKLFTTTIFDRLGFLNEWEIADRLLAREGELSSIDLQGCAGRWRHQGTFMHTPNHPMLRVMGDIARMMLQSMGVGILEGNGIDYVVDPLAHEPVWPVYPEIGSSCGVSGQYVFRPYAAQAFEDGFQRPMLSLEEFVHRSFEAYAAHDPNEIQCPRLDQKRFRDLAEIGPPTVRASERSQVSKSSLTRRHHPYSGLPAHQFWRQAVADRPPESVDPVVAAPFHIAQTTKVACAGSCFAQHIARALTRRQMQYHVTEMPPAGMAREEAARRGYGTYSARYGNLYTAKQLLQLFDRAFGDFSPAEDAWERSDGRWADPFRPEIEPNGFATIEMLRMSRHIHLASVRELFKTTDVMIFTLGLTEAWRSRADGAVFPIAPGVVAGRADPERYEFVNFGVDCVIQDLRSFLSKLRSVNPSCRMIFTVSPVPLVATYESQHVLTATTNSKSILRAAAGEVVRSDPISEYFPSYEIVTGAYNRGRYFASDLRTVTSDGVEHVMRTFFRHFAPEVMPPPMDEDLTLDAQTMAGIVCEEERLALDAETAASGSVS